MVLWQNYQVEGIEMKYHYYNLCFHANNTNVPFRTAILKTSDQKIKKYNLSDAKVAAGVNDRAPLVSASYLGYMTETEFENGFDPMAD